MKINLLILLSFFSVSSIYSKETKNVSKYYNQIFLGEKDAGLYEGPLFPDWKESSANGVEFKDKSYYQNFFYQFIGTEFQDWEELWFKKLPSESSCPNFYLEKNIDYMKYLFRLLSVSYLFESIKDHYQLNYELGLKDSNCSLNWDELFGSCRPKGPEMKKFLRRAKFRYLVNFDEREFEKMNSQEVRSWLREMNAEKVRASYRVSFAEVFKNCPSGQCSRLNKRRLNKTLRNSCLQKKKLIKVICSEEDKLYGMSYSDIPQKLLLKSNVLKVINKGGYGEQCLRRYARLFAPREEKYEEIELVFPMVYEQLKEKKATYIQGELFTPGALKEFDDQGLADFLYIPPAKPPAPKVVVKVKPPIVKPKPRPKPKPKPVVVAKARPKPAPRPVVKVVKVSHFEKSVKKLKTEKLKELPLNMSLFKSDFIFTKKLVNTLRAPLADFQKRESLNDMRTYDKLGSKEEPIRLFFLKYLIDENSHQGLWNIVSVIGKKFYVQNDIDKIRRPTLIELRNNQTTKNKWTIVLLNGRLTSSKKGPRK